MSGPNPTPPVFTFYDWPGRPEPAPTPEKPLKPTCPACQRELSSVLDAYYGPDDYWGRFCRPCRESRMKP